MKLKQLLEDLADHPIPEDIQISGLSLNTQQIEPGDLFIARKGATSDGRAFMAQAVAQGAKAIVAEAEGLANFLNEFSSTIPVIPVAHLTQQLEKLTKRFYGEPSQTLELMGFTGTNGKTTSTFLLAQCLTQWGIPCAVLGTVGYGFIHALKECTLTTPDIVSLSKYLFKLKEKGAQAVAMEVSSHGLAQERVKDLNFCSAIFTNLTQDHLDYHQTMENYGKAKQKLFQFSTLKRAILNADSFLTASTLPLIAPQVTVALYSLQPSFDPSVLGENILAFYPKEITLTPKGITAVIQTPWGSGKLHSPLLGKFNLSNLLGILAELCLREIPLSDALEVLGQAVAPPGRMQCLASPTSAQIIVDYAHTPDALENALKAARLHCQGRLWCVFGCGGNRDKDKRAKMGAMAEKYADHIILTNDNPRQEAPQNIIQDILQGIQQASTKVMVEADRTKAIAWAIHHSSAEDIVLIAGKGHENYQIIGDQKFPFSDVDVVKKFINKDNPHEIVAPS